VSLPLREASSAGLQSIAAPCEYYRPESTTLAPRCSVTTCSHQISGRTSCLRSNLSARAIVTNRQPNVPAGQHDYSRAPAPRIFGGRSRRPPLARRRHQRTQAPQSQRIQHRDREWYAQEIRNSADCLTLSRIASAEYSIARHIPCTPGATDRRECSSVESGRPLSRRNLARIPIGQWLHGSMERDGRISSIPVMDCVATAHR
jgi:hypothetical protein